MKKIIHNYLQKKKREKLIKLLKENIFVILGAVTLLIVLIVLKILKKKAKKKVKAKIKESIKNKVHRSQGVDESVEDEDAEME